MPTPLRTLIRISSSAGGGDNQRDCTRKGRRPFGKRNGHYTQPWRTPKGESSGRALLTESQVKQIRSKYESGKYTQGDLAALYEVGMTTIGHILHRRSWKHI